MKTRKAIADRVCCVCERGFGVTDPLPYEASVHYEDDQFAICCSQACRDVKGWLTHRGAQS